MLSTMVEHSYHHEYSEYEMDIFRELGIPLDRTRTTQRSVLHESIVRVDKN